jgi:deoxyribodipyrimidine photolyase-like uncharacterized protein
VRDVILMAKVVGEPAAFAHHTQKIVLIFAAMRGFEQQLRDLG